MIKFVTFSSQCPSDLCNPFEFRLQIMVVSQMIRGFPLPNAVTTTADERTGYGIEKSPRVAPVMNVHAGFATNHAPALITLDYKPA